MAGGKDRSVGEAKASTGNKEIPKDDVAQSHVAPGKDRAVHERDEVPRTSDDNGAKSQDTPKSVDRDSAESQAGDAVDTDPRGLPTRDLADRDPIRSMDEQSLTAQANTGLASVEALESFQKQVVSHIEGGTSLDQLESDVNEFLKSQGLPPVTMRASRDLGGDTAKYLSEQSIVLIREADLTGIARREELAASVMHELVHSEQDSLVILKQAQEAGVQGAPTDVQIESIQEKYRLRSDSVPSKDHIKAVLAARKGVPLSPDELSRASTLELSFADLASGGRLERESGVVVWVNEILDDPGAASALLNRVSKGEISAEDLFGKAGVPADVKRLLDDYAAVSEGRKDRASWNEAEAKAALKATLQKRWEELFAERQAHRLQYRYRPHELEAFAAHELARRQAGGQVAQAPTDLTIEERVLFGVADARELDALVGKPGRLDLLLNKHDGGADSSAAFTSRIGDRDISLDLGQKLIVGNTVIQNENVDKYHMAIGRDQNGVYVQDLKAKGGTWLRRKGQTDFGRLEPADKVYLRPGDTIRLGGKSGPEWTPEGLPMPDGRK